MRDLGLSLSTAPIRGGISGTEHMEIHLRWMWSVLALCSLALFAGKLFATLARHARRRTSFEYVPYSHDAGVKGVVVTDCTHPKAPTLSHHKGNNNPSGLTPSDTSTGLVLNAIRASAWAGEQAFSVCQNARITTNHFDVDSFLSVWCYINRSLALQHDAGAGGVVHGCMCGSCWGNMRMRMHIFGARTCTCNVHMQQSATCTR